MSLSSSTSACPLCVVMPSNLDLSQVFWYNSTVGLPLDTVSIVLSQYNGSVLTSTTTIHGDLASLSGTTLPQTVSIESEINAIFMYADSSEIFDYEGLVGYVLADTTNGTAINTLSYPTPYMAIAGIGLWTSVSSSCNQTSTTAYQPSCNICYLNGEGSFPFNGDMFDSDIIGSTLISLTSTFYAPLPYPSNYPTAVLERLAYYKEAIELPSSFIDFISSDTQLLMSLPILASCSYVPVGMGPPALKIPVSALTATVTATTTGSSLYPPGNTPTPANPIEPPIGPPTTMQPVVPPTPTNPASPTLDPPNQGSPAQISSIPGSANQNSPNQYAPEQGSPPQGSSPAAGDTTTQRASEPSQPLQPLNGNDPQDFSDDGSNQAPGESSTIAGANSGGSQQQAPPSQAEAGPALSYAGITIQPDASSQYDLPGIGKIKPGGPPITTASVIYSLAPSGSELISNGVPDAVSPVPDVPGLAQQPLVFTIGGKAYTADTSNFLIEGQTLTPGGTAITLSGTPISLAAGASQAIVGGSAVAIYPAGITPAPGARPVPTLTFAGSAYSANSLGQFVIGEQTLSPGAAITVSGTQISLAAAGNVAVIGSSTELLSPNGARTAAMLTFDGSTFTADASSEFVLGGQTLTSGGSIEVSGTPISYPAGASAMVIGTKTSPLSFATITSGVRPIITSFDGSTYTADASSDLTINGQTLTPGGNIDVSETPISYPLAGTAVVIGTSTEPFSFATDTGADTPMITFDGSTYTADASSDLVIDGQTLAPGGVITINGTPVSYAAGGTDVVIGTSTEAVGIGNLIMSGFGNGPSGPANTSVVQFTGALSRNRPAKGALIILSGILVWAVA